MNTIIKLIQNCVHVYYTLVNLLNLKLHSVQFITRPRISGKLVLRNEGSCSLGKKNVFNCYIANVPGGLNKTSCIRVARNARLEIGDFSGFTNAIVWCDHSIKIGSYCKIGTNTIIRDSDSHSLNYLERRNEVDRDIKVSPIIIGDDVFIGANSIILKGVVIGNRAIVAAGSVVSKSIPEDEIWGGNPARFIKRNQTYIS